jgi:tetratricopeptide (TPR) repeat protein
MYLLENNNSQSNEEAAQIARKLTSLEEYNSKAALYAVNLLEKTGRQVNAINYARKAIKLDQFNLLLREKDIQLTTEIALQQLNQNQKDNAIKVAKNVIAQYEEMELDINNLQRRLPGERFNSRKFHTSENIKYFTALSYFIIGNYSDANKLSNKLIDSKNKLLNSKAAALAFVANELNNGIHIEEINEKVVNNSEVQGEIKELKMLASMGNMN